MKKAIIITMFILGSWLLLYGVGLAGYHLCKMTINDFSNAFDYNFEQMDKVVK